METPFFDDFWQASELSPHNLREFTRMMDSHDPEGRQLRLDHPLAPTPLPRTHRRPLERLAARRRSGRGFSSRPLGTKDLARLLGSCRAWGGPEHRAFPSAGASYATEVFVVGWRVENHTGRMLYYDPVDHGLVTLPDPSPPWPEAQSRINAPIAGEPACLVVATLFPDRLTAKYGERGGRFALLEAGAVMQQLYLTAADLGLAGVVVGGLIDDYWLARLGLTRTGAVVAFGYLVGHGDRG